ncbi:hypothetical protein [Aliarcobacter cryaerophilus]|uniref:hypothetical protein n=1 Tax=Aliarcobacter cryaerophilus TaxID=28198 RepID=UPI0021B50CF7|nr:hypothetical protein [Aliarcobacter cryaerophilus]MCT7482416.1 hypothetical protein [Aliarcobacter cryaerophilus]
MAMEFEFDFEKFIYDNKPITIKLKNNLDTLPIDFSEIKNIFKSNIEEVLNKYGNVFTIDIHRLVKGTAYKVNSKYELMALIYEDLMLIDFKQIITSRLCIIFYRLTYFDMDASKAFVGRFFTNLFGESESFKINLNRNTCGLFFTDLNNKIFKGYRIKSIKLEVPDSIYDLKIKIAKKLLSKNIKIKIVADAIDIKEEELKEIIYGNNLNFSVINNNFSRNSNYVQKLPKMINNERDWN